MVANIELLDKTLDHIKKLIDFPKGSDQWDQVDWGRKTHCGTSACFAGWACVLSGKYEFSGSAMIDLETGRPDSPPWRAEDLLELTPEQAYSLFSATNTFEQLYEIIEEIKDGQ